MAVLNGEPMIATVAGLLRKSCTEVAISTPPGSGAAAWAASEGLPVLSDAPEHPAGPLAGVLAGLAWATSRQADLLATIPCDTPFLPEDFIDRLLTAPPAAVVTATTPDGQHPLCGLWRTSLAPSLEAVLARGRHGRVDDFTRQHGGSSVDFPDARRFANINAPADLDQAPPRGVQGAFR